MDKINIILVDDHQIVRDGIRAMLLTVKKIKIIGEAADYNELMKLLEHQKPDVIVLDISLPGKSGVEIAKELKSNNFESKILMLSANTDEDNIVEAIQAGAKGFLPKDTSKEEFVEAVNVVNNGDEYFGAKLSKIIYQSYTSHVKSTKDTEKQISLSARETETLKMLADGYTSKEIAYKLFISHRTVETHKSNILGKLNLKNNADLIKYAIKQGIVRL